MGLLERLFRSCEALYSSKFLRMHRSHKAMADPFGNGWGNGVPDCMIPQAVNPVCLAFIEMARTRPVGREALGELGFVRKEATHAAFRIPDIVTRPVSPSMSGGFRVDAVSDRFYEWSPLKISNDCLKEGGRFLPIRSTRRNIPVAAFWLKKYFSGTSPASMHPNNVDSTTLLGDSEILRVKHTPRDVIPALVQRLENDCEVSSSVGTKKPVDVFEDNCPWLARSNESHKVVKESRLGPAKPRPWPHSRKAEVLARESCCPDVRFRDFCVIEDPNVFI